MNVMRSALSLRASTSFIVVGMNWDAAATIWLNGLAEQPTVRAVALWIAVYGLLLYVAVAVWAWLHPSNKKERWRLQRVVVLATLSVMLAIVFEQVVTAVAFRARPFMVIDTLTAYNVFVDSSSFPSLHTAMAAAFAGAWLWSGQRKMGWWLLAAAVLIGLCRVVAGVHYPSDILGGLASGLLASWLVCRRADWLGERLDKE